MRDQVLWRKTARLITLLAERLNVSLERAMDILYHTETFMLFNNPDSGLQLMSDDYVVEDIIRELQYKQ